MPLSEDYTTTFARDRARSEAGARMASTIRRRMDELDIVSTRAFAEHVGMSWKPIDNLLNGKANPPLSTLLQLAHALDLRSLEELFGPFGTSHVLKAGTCGSKDQ